MLKFFLQLTFWTSEEGWKQEVLQMLWWDTEVCLPAINLPKRPSGISSLACLWATAITTCRSTHIPFVKWWCNLVPKYWAPFSPKFLVPKAVSQNYRLCKIVLKELENTKSGTLYSVDRLIICTFHRLGKWITWHGHACTNYLFMWNWFQRIWKNSNWV